LRQARDWMRVGRLQGSRARVVGGKVVEVFGGGYTSVPARRRLCERNTGRWGMDGGVSQENVVQLASRRAAKLVAER
jgi:hypothetical protein